VEMRVYEAGKVEDYTKKTLKEYVELKGQDFKTLSPSTELLVVAEKPGEGRLASVKEWSIKTMSWDEFEKKHLK